MAIKTHGVYSVECDLCKVEYTEYEYFENQHAAEKQYWQDRWYKTFSLWLCPPCNKRYVKGSK